MKFSKITIVLPEQTNRPSLMKQKIQLLALISLIGLASCQRLELSKKRTSLSTSALIVPVGFKWENSRTINFKVSVTDARFGQANNRILIYDGDPASGGTLLLKGFANNKTAYEGNIYLSNDISSVYIVKTAANNIATTTIVPVYNSDVEISMGI